MIRGFWAKNPPMRKRVPRFGHSTWWIYLFGQENFLPDNYHLVKRPTLFLSPGVMALRLRYTKYTATSDAKQRVERVRPEEFRKRCLQSRGWSFGFGFSVLAQSADFFCG